MTDITVKPVSSTGDNIKRAFRTLIQAGIAFLATGIGLDIWNNYVDNHEVHDVTVKFAVGVILSALIAWAHNQLEDSTGKALLLPVDRAAGDALLGQGVGDKQGAITGDTTPTMPTMYVKSDGKSAYT